MYVSIDNRDKNRIVLSDIEPTTNVSRKNFEIIRQTISMRSVPEDSGGLRSHCPLKQYGAEVLAGFGYVWEFDIEAVDAFYANGNKVGTLIDEMNNIVLSCGNVLKTQGDDVNVEFRYWPFFQESRQ
jgi:hypothetical protein